MATKSKIAVAGHICLDIIPSFPNESTYRAFPRPGQLLEVGKAVFSTGGAVSNTGMALYKLGEEIRLIGKVGKDDFGKIIFGLLEAYDPQITKHMIIDPDEHSSYSIIINVPGTDRTFLHHSGANNNFRADDLLFEHLKEIELFHFGYPSVMRQMYLNQGEQLALMFQKVRSYGILTSLDMAMPDPASEAVKVDWKRILSAALPNVDLFLPSYEEMFMLLFPQKHKEMAVRGGDFWSLVTAEDIRGMAAQLLNMGCRVAVLKLGELGVYMRTSPRSEDFNPLLDSKLWRGRELWAPCFKTNVSGTTGAGDSTIAGFLSSVSRGQTPEQCLNFASAVGACSVESADATSGIIQREQLQKRLQRGWERLPIGLLMDSWMWDEHKSIWVGPNDSGYTNERRNMK